MIKRIMKVVPKQFMQETKVIVANDSGTAKAMLDNYRGCWISAIVKTKQQTRKTDRVNVDYAKIEQAYKNRDKQVLIELLQERFLDYITNLDIELMYRYIKDTAKLRKLYDYADSNSRFSAAMVEV